MLKFRAKILSKNASTVPKLLAQNFGIEKLAGVFGLKTMPKFHAERIGLKWHFGGQMYRAYMSVEERKVKTRVETKLTKASKEFFCFQG